jgi:hypothetical protein
MVPEEWSPSVFDSDPQSGVRQVGVAPAGPLKATSDVAVITAATGNAMSFDRLLVMISSFAFFDA